MTNMQKHLICAAAVLAIASARDAIGARRQPTQPATTQSGIVLPDGPLKVTITGVEGTVQTRATPDQKWERVQVGQTFSEGVELRTGMKSAVRFSIGDSQIITIDRLSTIQILRANFQNGKFVTDLGMKYGRTRYDIEGAGREYDAKVHSPNSVLAVRGTKLVVYDQAPFAPEATSITGRVMVRDVRKQVTIGSPGGRKAKVSETTNSPADYSRQKGRVDPKSEFSGRTEIDQFLQTQLALSGGSDFSELGVLAFLDQARTGEFTGSLVGTTFVGKQLLFQMIWTGSEGSQIDLSVLSPLRELVSLSTPPAASGGVHLGSNPAVDGFGFSTVVWESEYPKGTYTVNANLVGGSIDSTTIQVTEDPQGTGTTVAFEQPSISATSPTFSFTVDPENPTIPPPTPQSVRKSQSVPQFVGPQRPPAQRPVGPQRPKK